MNTYVFFRESGFYPIELADDYDARLNAEINPGTIRVETVDGLRVWPTPTPQELNDKTL